jgi:hypothetical protein
MSPSTGRPYCAGLRWELARKFVGGFPEMLGRVVSVHHGGLHCLRSLDTAGARLVRRFSRRPVWSRAS